MSATTRDGRKRWPFASSRVGRAVVLGLVGTIGIVAGFEALVGSRAVNPEFVPPPSQVLLELVRLVQTPHFWESVGQTLIGWALGLLIATAIAIPSAILINSFSVVRHATRPIVEFLRPIPSVGLIPVAILIFGLGMEPKVFLVAFAALWGLLIQTVAGLRDTDPTQLVTAASYRIPTRDRILRVVIPSALPYVATGFRIAATTAIIVALVAELIIGSPGIGKDIALAQAGNATVTVYALIATTGLLGVAINVLIRIIERPVLHWHPSQREVTR